MKKKRLQFVLFWAFLVTSFLFFAVILVGYANGYSLNLENMKLERSAMIVLDGNLNGVNLTYTGSPLKDSGKKVNLPVRITKLYPAYYEVTLSKDNYQPWRKGYQLSPGEAELEEDIFLFLNTEKITKLAIDSSFTERINKNFQNQAKNVGLREGEILFRNALVTRLSQKVVGAIWDSGTDKIYFQVGNEIRVIDMDGTNDNKLLELEEYEPVAFFIDENYIYFMEKGSPYKAKIR